MILDKKEKEFLNKIKKESEYTGREDILGEILNGVFVGTVGLTGFLNPRAFDLLQQVEGIKRARRQKINRAISRIHNRGLVAQKGNKYYLTSKGAIFLNKYKINSIKIDIPKKWDGIFRIIMFDIPENKKYAREALNLRLKKLGFLNLQKSVFIFPYQCKKEFEEIGEFFDVEENIIFIETKVLSAYMEFIEKFQANGMISKKQKFK